METLIEGTVELQGFLLPVEGLEAAPGFEPGNEGFAVLCLTTWLCRHSHSFSHLHTLLALQCQPWQHPAIFLVAGVDNGKQPAYYNISLSRGG